MANAEVVNGKKVLTETKPVKVKMKVEDADETIRKIVEIALQSTDKE